MKDRRDDWDELAINKNRNRRKKSKRVKSKQANQDEIDARDFVGSLETSSGKYDWMKEKRATSQYFVILRIKFRVQWAKVHLSG